MATQIIISSVSFSFLIVNNNNSRKISRNVTRGQISVISALDIHSSQRMNPDRVSDLMISLCFGFFNTFPLLPPSAQSANIAHELSLNLTDRFP